MIEIPESRTLTDQLNQTIQGKKITRVVAGGSPHGFAFYFGSPEYYPSLMEGRIVDKAEAISGQIEVFVEDVRLVFNDGINIRYFQAGQKLPDKHQLLLEFDDGSAIVCTVQMYGGMQAFLDGECDSIYYLGAKEKPSPLSEQFSETYFNKLWKETRPSASAKAFLATEQRIPGLGNGVLQDILFHARINPRSKLGCLSAEERKRLYKSVKETLKEMTEKGGRDTEKDLFGCEGGYLSVLSKKTLTQPCPVCGGGIRREAYLGGNVYYCPNCQPVKK